MGNVSEIPLLRGDFKKRSNNPHTSSGEIHQYCPPEHVESEMDNLIAMYETHVKKGYPLLAIAAWLHHRFVQIHPFQDGNGRVARCLATLIFIKANWFPLAIRNNDERDRYIDALETADTGDLSPLINLFAAVQRRYFLGALSITEKRTQKPPDTETEGSISTQAMAQEPPITMIIKSAAHKLKQRKDKVTRGYESAEETANNILDSAYKRMEEINARIKQEFINAVRAYTGQYKNGNPNNRIWDTVQHQAGAHYKHYSNTNVYSARVRMSIQAKQRTVIDIYFHGVGQEYRGVIACFVHINIKGDKEFINDEIFQINYKESSEQAQKRFKEWLDRHMLVSFRLWANSL